MGQHFKSNSVDIVIPTYNAERFIGQTLDSVLSQTYKNFIIYVIDDGSTDRTHEIVSKYTSDKIIFIRQKNGGPSKARNNGFHKGSGEYIVFLDSDDLWEANFLEKNIAFMESRQNLGFVFTDFSTFNAEGTIIERWCHNDGRVFLIPMHKNSSNEAVLSRRIWSDLLTGSFLLLSGTLIKRSAIDMIGTFDESLTNAEDRDFFIRLSYQFDCGYIDECLFRKRSHNDSLSSNIEKFTKGSDTLGRRLLQDRRLSIKMKIRLRQRLANQWHSLGWHYLRSNQNDLATNSFSKSILLYPRLNAIIPIFISITGLYPQAKWLKHKLISK